MQMQQDPLEDALYKELTDFARAHGINLGAEAANFAVTHAINNIRNKPLFPNDDFNATVHRAAAALPVLLKELQKSGLPTVVDTKRSVSTLMKTCDGPYPWCGKNG